jgi:hypothetical protein
VQEADAESPPFAKGAFDAVVMNFGVLHLGQLEAAFTEAYRLSYRLSAIGFSLSGVGSRKLEERIVHRRTVADSP